MIDIAHVLQNTFGKRTSDVASNRPFTLSPRIRPSVWLLTMALGSAASSSALAQALPVATADPISTGFQLPTTAGSFQYSVSASELLTSGYYAGGGWAASTGVNGNAAVITSSRQYPFSLIASAGYFFATANQPSTGYVNLGASQVLSTKNWKFILTDAFSYFPATPLPGLSGVPGTGDLGVPPINLGIDTSQGLLTGYSTRINNAVSLNISRNITPRLSAQASGSYSALRFLGNAGTPTPTNSLNAGYGLNNDAYVGSGGLSYVVNPRTSFSGNYVYSSYVYQGAFPGFTSQTVSAGITHSFTRRLNGSFFAGPQWTTTQSVTGPNFTFVPGAPNVTSLGTFISANLGYSTKLVNYSVGYVQGTNAGYGVVAGEKSESIVGNASRNLGRYWQASANVDYTHSSPIGNTYLQGFSPTTLSLAGQASRALGRSLSVYGSYTREKQSGVGTGSLFDVFVGSFQVVGFGITYAPPAIRFGPH